MCYSFRVPLAVEVWKRDHQMSQNSLLGVAHVALSTVLKSSRSKALVRDRMKPLSELYSLSSAILSRLMSSYLLSSYVSSSYPILSCVISSHVICSGHFPAFQRS